MTRLCRYAGSFFASLSIRLAIFLIFLSVPAVAEQGAPPVDIPNAASPLNQVLTGGQPSVEALEAATRAGYKTVINLRMPAEDAGFDEAARVTELGMTYHSLPLTGSTALSEESATELDRLLKTADYPLIVHCASGNRVGAVLALRAFHIKGMSSEEAMAVGRSGGLTSMAPRVESYLADQESGVVDRTAGSPDTGYAVSAEHPFGRRHPDAPPELAQFAFMIGEFDCIDEIQQPDGSRVRFRAIWNAHYFLNGFGIQDEYWTPTFHTSNVRIFDPASGTWRVTFFRMPGYQSGVWEGRQEGDRMVMRQGGQTTGPGLTFHNIRPDGFDWHSGGDSPNWTSNCSRRR